MNKLLLLLVLLSSSAIATVPQRIVDASGMDYDVFGANPNSLAIYMDQATAMRACSVFNSGYFYDKTCSFTAGDTSIATCAVHGGNVVGHASISSGTVLEGPQQTPIEVIYVFCVNYSNATAVDASIKEAFKFSGWLIGVSAMAMLFWGL